MVSRDDGRVTPAEAVRRPTGARGRESFLADGAIVTQVDVPSGARHSHTGRSLGGPGVFRVGPTFKVQSARIVRTRGRKHLMILDVRDRGTVTLRATTNRVVQMQSEGQGMNPSDVVRSASWARQALGAYRDLPEPVLYDMFFEQVTRIKGLLISLERRSRSQYERQKWRRRRLEISRARDVVDPHDRLTQCHQLALWDQEETKLRKKIETFDD